MTTFSIQYKKTGTARWKREKWEKEDKKTKRTEVKKLSRWVKRWGGGGGRNEDFVEVRMVFLRLCRELPSTYRRNNTRNNARFIQQIQTYAVSGKDVIISWKANSPVRPIRTGGCANDFVTPQGGLVVVAPYSARGLPRSVTVQSRVNDCAN